MHDCNITGNGEYAVYAYSKNLAPVTIWATDNWWGTADSAAIEDMIYHDPDTFSQLAIQYVPFATEVIDHDTASTDIADYAADDLPTDYVLAQNYPNPFNSRTQIAFTLTRGQVVTLTVHNILGQEVALLADRHLPAGCHSFYWGADRQASGVYFYRLRGEQWTASRKMVLLR